MTVFWYSFEQTDDKNRPNQMQPTALYFRNGEFNENKENASILVNGQENSGNRKRKMFGGSLKPDTPPVSADFPRVFTFFFHLHLVLGMF